MHLCRRGDIGFPEAVIGAAAVCIVLSSFILFAYGAAGQTDSPVSPDWSFMNGSHIDHGVVVIDESSLESFAYRADVSGVSVETDAFGAIGIDTGEWSYGQFSGDKSVFVRLIDLPSDDGRTVPLAFRVIVWS